MGSAHAIRLSQQRSRVLNEGVEHSIGKPKNLLFLWFSRLIAEASIVNPLLISHVSGPF